MHSLNGQKGTFAVQRETCTKPPLKGSPNKWPCGKEACIIRGYLTFQMSHWLGEVISYFLLMFLLFIDLLMFFVDWVFVFIDPSG